MSKAWPRWLTVAAALLLLDISLSFENLWPTPAIRWSGGLSIEAALRVLGLAVVVGWRRESLSRPRLRAISAVWALLVIGRYADVTAPALYGREVNLYWDLRYVPDVTAMVVDAAPKWLVFAAVAAVGL